MNDLPAIEANKMNFFCPNHHELKWTEVEKCRLHSKNCFLGKNGYYCNQCSTYQCTFSSCDNNRKHYYGPVPLLLRPGYFCFGHNNNDETSGWICRICKFFICYLCYGGSYNKQQCMMNHSTAWTFGSQDLYCLNHKGTSKIGYKCSQNCDYFICGHCCKLVYSKDKCVLGHALQWYGERNQICVKHEQSARSGFACKDCNYFFCDTCAGMDYKNYFKKQTEDFNKTTNKDS